MSETITKKQVKEIEELIKKELPENYANEFLEKMVIKGYTKTPTGNVLKNNSESSWEYFVEAPTKEGSEHLNNLSRMNNFLKAKNKTPITYMKSSTKYIAGFKNKKAKNVSENEKYFKLTIYNTAKNLFPQRRYDAERKKDINLPNILCQYKDTILFHLTKPVKTDLLMRETSTDKIIKQFEGLMGSVDDRVIGFHNYYSTILNNIVRGVSALEAIETVKIEVEKLKKLIKRGGQIELRPLWVEGNQWKKDLARLIAIIEFYPWAALYLPSGLLQLDIIQKAINTGLTNNNRRPIDFTRKEDYYLNQKNYNLPLNEIFVMAATSERGQTVTDKINDNFYTIGKNVTDNQITEEDLGEDLVEARAKVKLAMERDDIPEFTASERTNDDEVDWSETNYYSSQNVDIDDDLPKDNIEESADHIDENFMPF